MLRTAVEVSNIDSMGVQLTIESLADLIGSVVIANGTSRCARRLRQSHGCCRSCRDSVVAVVCDLRRRNRYIRTRADVCPSLVVDSWVRTRADVCPSLIVDSWVRMRADVCPSLVVDSWVHEYSVDSRVRQMDTWLRAAHRCFRSPKVCPLRDLLSH